MIQRPRLLAAALSLAAIVATVVSPAPRSDTPRHPAVPFAENELVERGIAIVRLDPKFGAPPNACDEVSAEDLVVTVDAVPARVSSVERVPRPDRHWLLLDISGSAGGRRQEAIRSAREYVRRVMTPQLDFATVLTADDDALLVNGPSSDPAALDASLAAVSAGLGSALRDALATVLRQAQGDRHEHLILFWTDGQDTQSMTSTDELLIELQRAPNATVFPLVLMPTMERLSNWSPIGSFVFDVAKRSGGEVFASNDPLWLDRVRGWIARRFTVAFTIPEGAGDGRLKVAVRGRRCEATILPDPFARPDAVAGETPPAPPSWIRIHDKQGKYDDRACASDRGEAPWDWPLFLEGNGLTGCVLDAVAAVGPVVHGSGKGQVFDTTDARLAARDVRVVAPPFAELPRDLLDAIPWLLSSPGRASGARSPVIIEGNALLAQRARIASSLFAVRPDYRDFARARLARWADEDLRAIERDFRRTFPDLDDEAVSAIARASRAGRRLIGSSRTPTDADLARVLAAWLGDVPASELFRAWELRLVDALLAGHLDPDAVKQWAALRARFGQPQHLRVAAPLVLIHDEQRDLIGFWRVVLPRPMGYFERAMHLETAKERVEDRVPERPMALDLLERAMTLEGFPARLHGAAYRATRIDYDGLDGEREAPGGDPFWRARVTLTLEAPGRPPVVLETGEQAPTPSTLRRGPDADGASDPVEPFIVIHPVDFPAREPNHVDREGVFGDVIRLQEHQAHLGLDARAVRGDQRGGVVDTLLQDPLRALLVRNQGDRFGGQVGVDAGSREGEERLQDVIRAPLGDPIDVRKVEGLGSIGVMDPRERVLRPDPVPVRMAHPRHVELVAPVER